MTISPLPPPQAPSSVQPGGGWCWQLELAWGRLRRAWLRCCRPAYVRRMLAKRQGNCPNCPHDVIDPRDLKYWRNVCGYWFRAEDDPFGWRNHLGLARYGLVELFLSTALFLVLAVPLALAGMFGHGLCWLALLPPLVVWLAIVWFFRDPHRVIPADAAAVVSPADGTVTQVEEVDEADFPGGRALRISIFLSIFNVHLNRLPRSGRVTALRYFPGAFLDARHPDCPRRNEQLWIDLEEANGRRLRVKQISGAIARRIVCWLKVGEEVRSGDRLGMIKFGSRTELLVPAGPDLEVKVQVGARVHGGSTILLLWPSC